MVDGSKDNLADPESLLGMLQRGRGRGFLDALERPREEVWALLLRCITHDPMIDSQCETRAEYYAGLITATDMDLGPLRDHLRRNDVYDPTSDSWPYLAWDTLNRLARRGNSEAVRILRDYISCGQEWYSVLSVLADAETPEALAQTVAALCSRVRGDAAVHAQFEDVVRKDWGLYCHNNEDMRAKVNWFLPICEPWKSICAQNAEFADLFRSVGIDYDQPPPPEKPSKEYVAGLSLEDLFLLMNHSNHTDFLLALPDKVSASDEDYLLEQLATGDCYRMSLALRGLAELGTARAFAAVRPLIEGRDDLPRWLRVYAIRAAARMPGQLTLEAARRWFRRQEFDLHLAGGHILARQATREDVPLLIEALHTPEAFQGDDCRFHDALEALARFDGLGVVPELERTFCHTDYSYSRARAAKAMAATAPAEFTSRYARECLWDCHWDTREVGCRMVDTSAPGVVERIQELAADKNESDGTRQAAAKRLREL